MSKNDLTVAEVRDYLDRAIYAQAAAGGYGAQIPQPDPIERAERIRKWILG